MGWVRNPLLHFLAVVAVMLVGVLLATSALSSRAAEDEAVNDARDAADILARSVVEPAIPRGLVDGDPAAIDRMDRRVLARLKVDDVRRIKIWDREGRVLYADDPRLIGSTYALGEEELAVLSTGSLDAEISDLGRAENRFERGSGGLLEVYTRVTEPGGEPLLFEAYFSVEDIARERERVFASFRPITIGALVAFTALTTPLLLLLMRRVRRSADEQQRLLLAAVNASSAERVRIARDLHDGVVQDLAGSSFALSSVARRSDLPTAAATELEDVSRSLRGSMRSLRSLMVEIHPPELQVHGLEAALTDLLSPLVADGVRTSLEVGDLSQASPESVALAWRVAQECVRNVRRHAQASRIAIEVGLLGDDLLLTVTDDGVGFDPAGVPPARFGVRGMQGLARDAGGDLTVVSSPGRGTTTRMVVPAR